TEPTARSMPPTISRIVMPTTTMPSTEKLISMARKLPSVRKCGEAKLMTSPSARMIAISPASRIVPMRLKDDVPGAPAAIVSIAISLSPDCPSRSMICRACRTQPRSEADHGLFRHPACAQLARNVTFPDNQHTIGKTEQFRHFRRDDDDADGRACEL